MRKSIYLSVIRYADGPYLPVDFHPFVFVGVESACGRTLSIETHGELPNLPANLDWLWCINLTVPTFMLIPEMCLLPMAWAARKTIRTTTMTLSELGVIGNRNGLSPVRLTINSFRGTCDDPSRKPCHGTVWQWAKWGKRWLNFSILCVEPIATLDCYYRNWRVVKWAPSGWCKVIQRHININKYLIWGSESEISVTTDKRVIGIVLVNNGDIRSCRGFMLTSSFEIFNTK